MRQSVFAVLGDIAGCSFLDLYSGSGIIGIEAASRGAEPVILVEKDPAKRKAILANLSFVTSQIELVIAPVEAFLSQQGRQFDYVFLDPPFSLPGKEALLRKASTRLAAGGVVLLHLPRSEKLESAATGATGMEEMEEMEEIDRRRYGQSLVVFWRRTAVVG